MQYKNILNTFIAVFGTTITCLIGGWDSVLKILAVLIIIDYVTGLMKGVSKGQLSSEVGWKGLLRKAAIFLVIILANQVDMAIPQENPIFRTMACYFYIANEGISILENIALLGVPFPEFLLNTLQKLKNENDKKPDTQI